MYAECSCEEIRTSFTLARWERRILERSTGAESCPHQVYATLAGDSGCVADTILDLPHCSQNPQVVLAPPE